MLEIVEQNKGVRLFMKQVSAQLDKFRDDNRIVRTAAQ